MSDLDKLIGAVESGVDTAHHHAAAFPSESAYGKCTWHDSHKASSGSLDAAKALHEALLPGWHWKADDGQGQDGPFWVVFRYTNSKMTESDSHVGQAESEHASRSWLIATLKAYRSLQ